MEAGKCAFSVFTGMRQTSSSQMSSGGDFHAHLFQSAPLAVALVLLAGTVARAQATAREQRQRTVTGNPAEPPHEVRVSTDSPTVFLFSSEILKKAVRVDASRIRVVDAGERSITASHWSSMVR